MAHPTEQERSRLTRAEVVFRGHVQGVGFRATTQGIARGFAVTGWVRNEADGSVRMIVEGAKPEINALLNRVRADMGHHLSSPPDIAWSEPTGEFDGFTIRR